MTTNEWLNVGIQNGIIDKLDIPPVPFSEVYRLWFKMKMNVIKPQSLDRIEVTYNRYYANSELNNINVADINVSVISEFLTSVLVKSGTMTSKEFARVYQIINNVMTYALDLDIGGTTLINWGKVKRYLPSNIIKDESSKEFCVAKTDKERLFKAVLDKAYYEKQSACYCLALNFCLGLRIGELASLTWQDIDYDRRMVRIFKTETKCYERDIDGNKIAGMAYRVLEDTKTIYSVREVPLTSDALNIIRLIKEHHTRQGYRSPYLAYDGVEDGILIRSLDRTLRKLCKLCGIQHINSHKIRKTFATELHLAGVPTRIISDLIGHADISTTEQYYIISSINVDEIRATMEGVFKYV